MQSLMMLFDFFVFVRKYSFWANLVQKNENIQFKLKFGTYINSNMQDSMGMFIVFISNQKYLFWENLVQIVKIDNSLITKLV